MASAIFGCDDSILHMISVPELPNFDAEWEKHQKKEALFRNVARTKNAYTTFVVTNPSIEDQEAELKKYESEIEVLEADLGLLKSEQSRLSAVSENLEHGLFQIIKSQDDDEDSKMFIDGMLKGNDFTDIKILEEKLESSQRLVSFFQQRIEFARNQLLFDEKVRQATEWRQTQGDIICEIEDFKREVLLLKESYSSAVQDWSKVFGPVQEAVDINVDMPEASEAQGTKSFYSSKKRPSNDWQMTECIMYDFTSLQSDNRDKYVEVATFELRKDIAIKSEVPQAQPAMVHLSKAGIAIRNRVLEKTKARSAQSESVIDLGNLAAHQGAPLADALLYTSAAEQLTGNPRRKDISTYVAMYGFSPELVAKSSHCKAFHEMLSLGFGMKTMSAAFSHAYPKKSEPADFKRVLRDIAAKNNSGSPEYYEKYLTGNSEGIKHMANLKALFSTVLKEYKRPPWSSKQSLSVTESKV